MDRASPGHFAGRPPKSEVKGQCHGADLRPPGEVLHGDTCADGWPVCRCPLMAPSWNGIQGTVLLGSLGFPAAAYAALSKNCLLATLTNQVLSPSSYVLSVLFLIKWPG